MNANDFNEEDKMVGVMIRIANYLEWILVGLGAIALILLGILWILISEVT